MISFHLSRRLAISTATALLCLSGCHRAVIYSPGKLPAEYLATEVHNATKLDLSRLAQASVDSQKVLPGDVLSVEIVTGLETDDQPKWPPIRVGEHGTVKLPLVGSVEVAGLDLDQAEQLIRTESIRRGFFRAPNVSVTMDNRRESRVTVAGAVEDPGVKELTASGCDLFTALVAAGGLSDDASTIVEIRHPRVRHPSVTGSATRQVSYPSPAVAAPALSERIDLAESDVVQRNLRLSDGSVVMVMRQPERTVQVIGLVKDPRQVKMPTDHEMRLLDAIAQAGGLTLQVANRVHVIRRLPGREGSVVIQTTIRDAKSRGEANLVLASGDVVSVEETPVTFTVETLRSFMRFGFSSTMPGF